MMYPFLTKSIHLTDSQLAQLYATILEESQQKTQESVDNLGTGLEVARSQTAEYNMVGNITLY